MTERLPGHEHDWRLLAVDFDDGRCTHVFGCTGCAVERFMGT